MALYEADPVTLSVRDKSSSFWTLIVWFRAA
jgi:hypothetical protein